MLRCPFCGSAETDRFDLEGRRFVVFGCMFSPSIARDRSDEELTAELVREFGRDGDAHFRRTCDRLHLFVTQGDGARELKAADGEARSS